MRETLNLTEEDGLQALRMHLQERARVAHLRYPDLGQESSLRALLRDGEIVRFPVELRFGTEGLIPGEFAHAEPKEDRAAAGFTLFVHPQFEGRWADLAPLVLYHVPSINYLDVAGAEEAELFGATALGLDIEDYYKRICTLADELGPAPVDPLAASVPGADGLGGCGTHQCSCQGPASEVP
ncbi:MAG: hypothetical protein R3F33_14665 [Planctomycetota bacterium]